MMNFMHALLNDVKFDYFYMLNKYSFVSNAVIITVKVIIF